MSPRQQPTGLEPRWEEKPTSKAARLRGAGEESERSAKNKGEWKGEGKGFICEEEKEEEKSRSVTAGCSAGSFCWSEKNRHSVAVSGPKVSALAAQFV